MTEPKRDTWGRYIIPHPDDPGKEVHWTRATTFAESIEDQYNIKKWAMRATAVGISRRQDMVALAGALDVKEDKKQLDQLCDKALTVATADSRSNLGTALHKFTERIDGGTMDPLDVPQAHRNDLYAYLELKSKHGIHTHRSYIERITVLPEWNVAGTMDRIVKMGGKVYIGDLKTGDSLDYGMGKIAVQLALYAHGVKLWNEQTGEFEDMPPVDQKTGLVFHVPAGTGTATLYEVDIESGWEAAQICAWVRDWRKKGRSLARSVS